MMANVESNTTTTPGVHDLQNDLRRTALGRPFRKSTRGPERLHPPQMLFARREQARANPPDDNTASE